MKRFNDIGYWKNLIIDGVFLGHRIVIHNRHSTEAQVCGLTCEYLLTNGDQFLAAAFNWWAAAYSTQPNTGDYFLLQCWNLDEKFGMAVLPGFADIGVARKRCAEMVSTCSANTPTEMK